MECDHLLFIRTPDYSKAINSASNILDLLDRQPLIDNGSTDGKELVSKHPNSLGTIISFAGVV